MADRLESTDSHTPTVGTETDTTTSGVDDTMAQQQQHAYRLPELTEAMRQTVSYGGCAVISPLATQYQRMDLGDPNDSVPMGGDTSSKHAARTSATASRGFMADERCSHSSSSSTGGGGGSHSGSRHFSGNDAFNSKTGRPHTLILRFDVSGNATFQQMSRLDVLRLAQDAARPKPTMPLPPTESDYYATDTSDTLSQDTLGEVRSASRTWPQRRGSRRLSLSGIPADFAAATPKTVDVKPVNARDIRKLDHAFAVSNEPSIVVRRQAILMNADPLRAVIMRDACLVFVPDGADSLLHTLKTNFRQHTLLLYPSESESGHELPFEMRALEALLATICRYFEYDYDKTAPVVSHTLDRLAHGRTISTGDLETLRGFKNTMNEFESQVDGVRRALMEMLDDEDGLHLLHLTKLHDAPSLLGDLYSFDSEDVEVLMENYLQDIFSTRTKATLLQHRIQNTESLVMLKLDSMRNYLLGVELIFSLVAISISVGTYVTGAFGMNLNSHLQQTDGWFWGVVVFTFVAFIVIMASGIVFFRQKGVLL